MAHTDFTVAPYTTGDLIDGRLVSYRLSFIPHQWMLLAVMGALTTLCDPDNWNNVGEQTPIEAADLAIRMVEDFNPMVDQTGMVIPFAGSTVPDGSLLCNGASYLRSDYPDLFAVIGTVWGSADSTHFNVPDLRGRTVVAVGTGSGLTPRSLASQFGEETHTLITAEMPAHSHTDTGHVHAESVALPNVTTIGLEVPEATALPGVGSTGISYANLTSTGGDGAHNNMQPSVALNYIILTR